MKPLMPRFELVQASPRPPRACRVLIASDPPSPLQTLEMLKMLLDPETLDAGVEKDAFMDLFYDSYMKKASQVLLPLPLLCVMAR